MSTITTTVQPATGSLLTRLLRRHPLVAFFLLTLGLTWPFMIADALRSHGFLPAGAQVYLLLGQAYGPTWAALIVTGATTGKAGIRALLRRLLVWRMGIQWYAVAIFGTAFLFYAPIKLHELFGGTPPTWPPLSMGLIPTVVLSFVVRGLVNGEEIGWRGFALPQLQARHSALSASLMVGAMWALFHLPLFFTRDNSFSATNPFMFLASMLAMSVLFTWVYNNTGGSLLLAYLLHASVNTWSEIVPIGAASPWVGLGVNWLAAVIVVAVYGPARLSRKPVAELPVPIDTSTVALTNRTYAEAHRQA
jgi:membrane protease YdiL (CAAX protease family)